ncbi:PQQ-dependent sugar dehydrogenase [Candidatus Saccharibacteria bacterium]|nr:PQQ-dependent sugar dehydrogenase [Candidatus Saccharibacteria bacterium]
MEESRDGAKRQKKRLVYIVAGGIGVILLSLFLWSLLRDNKIQSPASPNSIATQKESKIKLNFYVAGLTSPTSIAAPKDQADKRLFVLEQAGLIRIINKDSQLETQPFLDITQKILNNGEMGLLGLVFHPNYASNAYFYVNYINKAQETIIARYKVSSEANKADPSSEKILLKTEQPYPNHKGGDLKFGPDGFLYIALGDGGSAGDPENRAQDKNSLLGKILRIDVDKGDPYAIPPTNPFVNQAGVQPEIWAYGLRNPWRISFDKTIGDLYVADVGQGDIEEVNVQKASSKGGTNYGWRCYEGNKVFNNQGCLELAKYEAPAFEYTHEENRCSITGGYVYRGSLYPTLNGKYFYGDYCNGQLFYAEKKDGKWQQTLVAKTPYAFSTFGQGSDSELYVADYTTGIIYKITDTAN